MTILPNDLKARVHLKRPIAVKFHGADGRTWEGTTKTLEGWCGENGKFTAYTALASDSAILGALGRLRCSWSELVTLHRAIIEAEQERIPDGHEVADIARGRLFEWDNINPAKYILSDTNIDGIDCIDGPQCQNCACVAGLNIECSGCHLHLCDGCLAEHNNDAPCHIDADRWEHLQEDAADWYEKAKS